MIGFASILIMQPAKPSEDCGSSRDQEELIQTRHLPKLS
jgi:hypothetical protein